MAAKAWKPFLGILGGFVATIPLGATSLVDVAKFFTFTALLIVAGQVVPMSLVGATSYFIVVDDFVFVAPLGLSTALMAATFGISRACSSSQPI